MGTGVVTDDSGSEHPPLISQSLADQMGLRGPLAGGATQANGEYLPLYDVGQLHMELNGKTVTENFLSAPLSHYDIILGESWLKKNSGIMDYAHGQLWQWTLHRILIPWIRCTPLSARPFARA